MRIRPGMAVAVTTAGLVSLLSRVGTRSGVTSDEAADALPGDEIVPHPMWHSTRGITIQATAEQVWPWIVQMGFRRIAPAGTRRTGSTA